MQPRRAHGEGVTPLVAVRFACRRSRWSLLPLAPFAVSRWSTARLAASPLALLAASLPLAARLAVAVAVIMAPTVLFLGFWRLLVRMRNGELVERVMSADRVAEESTTDDVAPPDLLDVLRSGGRR